MKTLVALFWESTRTIRFVMMLVSLLGAIGIWLRAYTPTGDISLLLSRSPWWAWSGILFAVALNRWWCLWYGRRCTDVCASTTSALIVCGLAIFVWVELILSSWASNEFGLAVMMMVCIICEFWLMSRVFAQKLFKKTHKE